MIRTSFEVLVPTAIQCIPNSNSLPFAETLWRYGVPCLENQHATKTFSVDEELQILGYIEEVLTPPVELLKKWLSRPFYELEKRGMNPTPENLQLYFRYLHSGPNEATPVYWAHVLSTFTLYDGIEIVVVERIDALRSDKDKVMKVQNIHRLPLEKGDMVTVHGYVVAEKI